MQGFALPTNVPRPKTSMNSAINIWRSSLAAAALSFGTVAALGHDVAGKSSHHADAPQAVALPFIVEKRGPVSLAKHTPCCPNEKVSGSGYWKFIAQPELTPVPAAAMPKLKGAHGTIIVDKANDVVYWGLERVGWIGFSNKLKSSWIVSGDPIMAGGNLHGADILPRKGKPSLVAAADNNTGQVFLTDTTFQHATVLRTPKAQPYADGKGFAPTDVAFQDDKTVWVTDGYGKAWFMPATVEPFDYAGSFFGGKSFSGTPHGISYDASTQSMFVSARPEGQVKQFNLKHEHLEAIDGLPAGSTVCDVDIWGDYALAPCLDGANRASGPIYIINLRKRAVVATIKPKEDLGYDEALHIHDAAWYVTGKGRSQEVYIVFTAWNPGGVGALKLVNLPN